MIMSNLTPYEILTLRLRSKMTPEHLAKVLGITLSRYLRWERGVSNTPLKRDKQKKFRDICINASKQRVRKANQLLCPTPPKKKPQYTGNRSAWIRWDYSPSTLPPLDKLIIVRYRDEKRSPPMRANEVKWGYQVIAYRYVTPQDFL